MIRIRPLTLLLAVALALFSGVRVEATWAQPLCTELRKTAAPSPADNDAHVDADDGAIELAWRGPSSAVKYEVFLASGTTAEAAFDEASAARPGDDAHLGTVERISAPIKIDPKKTLLHYAWRVDAVDADGSLTSGDVWQFRARHPAFPGAQGHGRFAIGGRGGRVIKVTNLNDGGSGSFRAAVEADGPRTVVFDVGGKIVLQDELVIRNPYLTIAGQTAPGKGICIANHNLGMLGTHDVIVRFLHVRPGDASERTLNGIEMVSTEHSIIDHGSISGAQDEGFSSRDVCNVGGLNGPPDSQNAVGGWEDYPEVRRDADWDSDDDGIPSEWEERHGLNPNSPAGDLSDANGDRDGDGYVNLEDYLFSTVAEADAKRRDQENSAAAEQTERLEAASEDKAAAQRAPDSSLRPK